MHSVWASKISILLHLPLEIGSPTSCVSGLPFFCQLLSFIDLTNYSQRSGSYKITMIKCNSVYSNGSVENQNLSDSAVPSYLLCEAVRKQLVTT